MDAYKAAAASATANVAPTFLAQGGILSQAAPASASGSNAPSSGSTSTATAMSAANLNNIHEAGMTAIFAVAMLALFGGFMAVF